MIFVTEFLQKLYPFAYRLVFVLSFHQQHSYSKQSFIRSLPSPSPSCRRDYSRRRRFTVKQKSHTGLTRKHVTFNIMTFVWLFGALVRVCAIDYDHQENFWDLSLYGKVLKKYFVSVLARGVVDPTPALWLDPRKTRFGGTLGR